MIVDLFEKIVVDGSKIPNCVVAGCCGCVTKQDASCTQDTNIEIKTTTNCCHWSEHIMIAADQGSRDKQQEVA